MVDRESYIKKRDLIERVIPGLNTNHYHYTPHILQTISSHFQVFITNRLNYLANEKLKKRQIDIQNSLNRISKSSSPTPKLNPNKIKCDQVKKKA